MTVSKLFQAGYLLNLLPCRHFRQLSGLSLTYLRHTIRGMLVAAGVKRSLAPKLQMPVLRQRNTVTSP